MSKFQIVSMGTALWAPAWVPSPCVCIVVGYDVGTRLWPPETGSQEKFVNFSG